MQISTSKTRFSMLLSGRHLPVQRYPNCSTAEKMISGVNSKKVRVGASPQENEDGGESLKTETDKSRSGRADVGKRAWCVYAEGRRPSGRMAEDLCPPTGY